MRSIVLVAACLACASHAHKHVAEQMRENDDVPDVKMFARLLMASSPKSAFTFSTPGMQPLRTGRRSTPLMQDNAPMFTAGTGADPLQAAQEELLQNQKKMTELRAQMASQPGSAGDVRKNIGKSDIVLVQGGSLKTWSYHTSHVDRVQVVLGTDGRPLDADVQLWQGPDNTPTKMRVYSEDGSTRPFSAVIATPDDSASTVAIYNTGHMEFPLAAHVIANDVDEPISDFRDTSIIIQGGALRTFDFNTAVDSVEIMLKTDGRPLNARIELLQGPNNIKQVIELYTEDGLARPFFAIVDSIGTGNVVRVVNTAPLEFPMFASVQPHSINEKVSATDPIIGDR